MDKVIQILENVVRCKYIEAGVHSKNPIKNSYQDGLGRTTQTLDHVVVVHKLIWDKRKSHINEYSYSIIVVLFLKSLGDSWSGRKFWPIQGIFIMFMKWSSGVGTPNFGGMKGMRLVLEGISYITPRSIGNSSRHLNWCFEKLEENKRKMNINLCYTKTCDVHSLPLVHVYVVIRGRGGLVPIVISGPLKSLIKSPL